MGQSHAPGRGIDDEGLIMLEDGAVGITDGTAEQI